MPIYRVTLRETVVFEVEVEANNAQEAKERAWAERTEEEIVDQYDPVVEEVAVRLDLGRWSAAFVPLDDHADEDPGLRSVYALEGDRARLVEQVPVTEGGTDEG